MTSRGSGMGPAAGVVLLLLLLTSWQAVLAGPATGPTVLASDLHATAARAEQLSVDAHAGGLDLAWNTTHLVVVWTPEGGAHPLGERRATLWIDSNASGGHATSRDEAGHALPFAADERVIVDEVGDAHLERWNGSAWVELASPDIAVLGDGWTVSVPWLDLGWNDTRPATVDLLLLLTRSDALILHATAPAAALTTNALPTPDRARLLHTAARVSGFAGAVDGASIDTVWHAIPATRLSDALPLALTIRLDPPPTWDDGGTVPVAEGLREWALAEFLPLLAWLETRPDTPATFDLGPTTWTALDRLAAGDVDDRMARLSALDWSAAAGPGGAVPLGSEADLLALLPELLPPPAWARSATNGTDLASLEPGLERWRTLLATAEPSRADGGLTGAQWRELLILAQAVALVPALMPQRVIDAAALGPVDDRLVATDADAAAVRDALDWAVDVLANASTATTTPADGSAAHLTLISAALGRLAERSHAGDVELSGMLPTTTASALLPGSTWGWRQDGPERPNWTARLQDGLGQARAAWTDLNVSAGTGAWPAAGALTPQLGDALLADDRAWWLVHLEALAAATPLFGDQPNLGDRRAFLAPWDVRQPGGGTTALWVADPALASGFSADAAALGGDRAAHHLFQMLESGRGELLTRDLDPTDHGAVLAFDLSPGLVTGDDPAQPPLAALLAALDASGHVRPLTLTTMTDGAIAQRELIALGNGSAGEPDLGDWLGEAAQWTIAERLVIGDAVLTHPDAANRTASERQALTDLWWQAAWAGWFARADADASATDAASTDAQRRLVRLMYERAGLAIPLDLDDTLPDPIPWDTAPAGLGQVRADGLPVPDEWSHAGRHVADDAPSHPAAVRALHVGQDRTTLQLRLDLLDAPAVLEHGANHTTLALLFMLPDATSRQDGPAVRRSTLDERTLPFPAHARLLLPLDRLDTLGQGSWRLQRAHPSNGTWLDDASGPLASMVLGDVLEATVPLHLLDLAPGRTTRLQLEQALPPDHTSPANATPPPITTTRTLPDDGALSLSIRDEQRWATRLDLPDPTGDVALAAPTGPDFDPGAPLFDLTGATVETSAWQARLTVGLAALDDRWARPQGWSHPVVHVYVDLDGTTESAPVPLLPGPRASVSAAGGWEVALVASPESALVVSRDGGARRGLLTATADLDAGSLVLTWPLEVLGIDAGTVGVEDRVNEVLTGSGWLVVVGGAEVDAADGWREADPVASVDRFGGGGEPDPEGRRWHPRVTDVWQPAEVDQSGQLASWVPGRLAVLEPVRIGVPEQQVLAAEVVSLAPSEVGVLVTMLLPGPLQMDLRVEGNIGGVLTISVAGPGPEHIVLISDLLPDTTYVLGIRPDANLTFTTPAASTDVTAPAILQPALERRGAGEVVLTWASDEPMSEQVLVHAFGAAEPLRVVNGSPAAAFTVHEVAVTGLGAGTYEFVIAGADAAGNRNQSARLLLTLLPQEADPSVPALENGTADREGSEAALLGGLAITLVIVGVAALMLMLVASRWRRRR